MGSKPCIGYYETHRPLRASATLLTLVHEHTFFCLFCLSTCAKPLRACVGLGLVSVRLASLAAVRPAA
jgi:hypothetical protein